MDDYDNPYHSPLSDETSPAPDSLDETIDPRTIGKAKYVPTIAVLMMVHGVFMFIAACGMIVLIFFVVPQMTKQIEDQQQLQRRQNPNAPVISNKEMATILNTVYGGLSAVLFTIGIVNFVAGIQNLGYRNRILGIISLVVSMGSILSVWCLPLSIGLMIFGMIIYLSPEAERAFNWRASNPDVG